MAFYASALVLPLLQLLALIVIIKKLRGSRSLYWGITAVGCWLLSGLVSMFYRSAMASDQMTVGMILGLLSFVGWGAFLAMLLTIPVAVGKEAEAPPIAARTEPAHEAPGGKPDLVYRYGRIGAAVGWVIYLAVSGFGTLADGDILTGALWGFISGAVGGGAGAAVGLLLEKMRSRG